MSKNQGMLSALHLSKRGSMSETLRPRLSFSLAAVLLALAPLKIDAQLSSATVTGVVRDSSGSVIPGVKIVLVDIGTTTERTATSNNAGNYVFLSIPPGTYNLEATSPGLQTTKIANLTLEVNQTATAD